MAAFCHFSAFFLTVGRQKDSFLCVVRTDSGPSSDLPCWGSFFRRQPVWLLTFTSVT